MWNSVWCLLIYLHKGLVQNLTSKLHSQLGQITAALYKMILFVCVFQDLSKKVMV